MVTAIGRNHHRIDLMIGPGRGLDTDRLGNSLPTSPSTSATQHGPDFPRFSIRDMVQSQHLLLQHLGITHLQDGDCRGRPGPCCGGVRL